MEKEFERRTAFLEVGQPDARDNWGVEEDRRAAQWGNLMLGVVEEDRRAEQANEREIKPKLNWTRAELEPVFFYKKIKSKPDAKFEKLFPTELEKGYDPTHPDPLPALVKLKLRS